MKKIVECILCSTGIQQPYSLFCITCNVGMDKTKNIKLTKQEEHLLSLFCKRTGVPPVQIHITDNEISLYNEYGYECWQYIPPAKEVVISLFEKGLLFKDKNNYYGKSSNGFYAYHRHLYQRIDKLAKEFFDTNYQNFRDIFLANIDDRKAYLNIEGDYFTLDFYHPVNRRYPINLLDKFEQFLLDCGVRHERVEVY